MTRAAPLAVDCADDCLIAQAVAGLCVGLVLVSRAGDIFWLNRAAEEILGVRKAQCIGRPMRAVLKDPQLAAFWDEAAQCTGNCLGEVSMRWPQALELKVNATHCADHNGVKIGRALLFCDVTAERAVQVQLSHEVASRLLDLTGSAPRPEALDGLTQQELRVLRLVGQGLSNDDIGGQLSISASTVRSHLKNLYRKLGLGSRSEAVSYSVRNHLT